MHEVRKRQGVAADSATGSMLCMRPRDVDGSESQATSCDQGGPDAHGEVWNTIPILKAGFMKRLRLLALLLALTKTTRGMKRAIVGLKKKADCPKGK